MEYSFSLIEQALPVCIFFIVRSVRDLFFLYFKNWLGRNFREEGTGEMAVLTPPVCTCDLAHWQGCSKLELPESLGKEEHGTMGR